MANKYDTPMLFGNNEFVIGLRPEIFPAIANIALMEADRMVGGWIPGDVLSRRFLGIYNENDSRVANGFWTSEQAESVALAIQAARESGQPTILR